MGRMNVSLTGELQQFVESEVAQASKKLEFLRQEIAVGVADVKAERFATRTADQILMMPSPEACAEISPC